MKPMVRHKRTTKQQHQQRLLMLSFILVGLLLYVSSFVLMFSHIGSTDVPNSELWNANNLHVASKSSIDNDAATHREKTRHELGIVSTKDPSFFRSLQDAIDSSDPVARCTRYGGTFRNETAGMSSSSSSGNSSTGGHAHHRRIFFGALIASEPRELLEIVAAEAYGVYTALVLVESNRTPSFASRTFTRLSDTAAMAQLFGISAHKVQIRPYINEDATLLDLEREHAQRAEILLGWKELGMQPDDIGLLADLDETFSRDVLRAVQECDESTFPMLQYQQHYCHHGRVKLRATTRIFEASPECSYARRAWYHPDMILGHCIQGIGKASRHGLAPRDPDSTYLRAHGYGQDCHNDWYLERQITNGRYPLWNAADFRRTCSGPQLQLRNHDVFDKFTAFHLHNFFASAAMVRFKYQTYGHADADANHKPMANISHDLEFMLQCAVGTPELGDYGGVDGGFASMRPVLPIYFYDDDYRRRRHEHVRRMIVMDHETHS
jgi:Glycosyltransferase family 17